MSGRTGLTRFELVASVFVAVLAAVGIAALVPSFHGGSAKGPSGGSGVVTELDSAAMAGPRAAAALPPCPSGDAGAGKPEAGPLAGIEEPCLGGPGTVRPAAALAGRETLLNIWATWCVPCREELPALAQYAARPGSPPVLTVNVHDNPVTALNLLHELKVQLPAIVDSGDAMFISLKIVALPASFVMHPDGSVTQLLPQTAYTTPDEIAAAVEKARAGKVGP